MTVLILHITISLSKKITFNDITDQQGQSEYIPVKATIQSSKF